MEGVKQMNALYSNYSPTLLYVEKYSFPSTWVYPEAKCPYSMVRYVISGSAIFSVDGERYTVKKGDVFYIPQGCLLYCIANTKIEFISVRFFGSIQLPEENMLNYLWNVQQLYHFQDDSEMRKYFEEIYRYAVSKFSYKRLFMRGYLNLICANLAAITSEEKDEFEEDRNILEALNDIDYLRDRALESLKNKDPRINTLVEYITLHPEKNLTQAQMCEMVSISGSTLRRIFKKETGKTIFEFVNERKMQYAAHLLVTTIEPISEISYQLGYESPSYFSKQFRENYGISPQAYRKNSKEA